ncbi:MAG: DEAD/DEAH box helicase [Planctomycetes bacterium]|nr:DEAD/DEAH box helicase [Planctomycetota bacterium]MBM4057708.1 DEAD/DEAH box helicase [Planctomycetota bacterium]
MTSPTTSAPTSSFADLGLSAPLLRALADEGYSQPTPIQDKAVPHVLAGRDLFGCAQTGTGKTAAFALPLIDRLLAAPRPPAARACRVLVLAPTRELAAQIHDSFLAYGRHARIRAAVIYGGVGQHQQARAMAHGVDVLVATPGRLLDLVGQRLVDLRAVECLVLDEADRMLDMGFIHDVRKIVAMLPVRRQTLFFSATLPAEVRDLADAMLRDPLEVRTAPRSTPAETVSQSVFFVPKREKKALLVKLLAEEATGRVIVFARTKHGADKLHRDLDKAGIRAAAIHGNKSQAQRERALAAFKSPRPPVLVATDIAARGIDVDDVAHVINYELPHEPETYVHRIGRTGRAGQEGVAVSFCDVEEHDRLDAIERLLKREIPARNPRPVTTGPQRPRDGHTAEGARPPRGRGTRGRRQAGRRGDGGHGSKPTRPTAVDGAAAGGPRPVAAVAGAGAGKPARRKHRRAL